MADDIIARVRARVYGTPAIHDMAEGLSPAPHMYPTATPDQIAAAEAELGFPLPALLKRILMEIGNGGFGPGYGLIGVRGGYEDFSEGCLEQACKAFRAADPNGALPPWPEKVIPICTWGCGIYSCLDCGKPEAPVLVFNPDTHVLDDENLEVTLTDADGNVVWEHKPEQKTLPAEYKTPTEISLVLHKPSFEEWISAWADGMDLWEDMQEL